MNDFMSSDMAPERAMWCVVIHQAVRDLFNPNSNAWSQPMGKPFKHPTWASAMEFVFSGTQDDHAAWELSGLSPTTVRHQVIEKMTTGETVGKIGSRESALGPIDYRSMRATVLLALKQVADFYKTDGVDEMVAEDSRTEFRKMLSMFKQNRTWIQL
jgi:hypothetical protein